MTIRLGSTVINCADLELMTAFWTQALHLAPSQADGDDFRVLRDDQGRRLSLQHARTPVTARDQMHLDLFTDDQAAEVDRLTGLGAQFVRHNQDPDDDYVVMTDPEGNEFCLCVVDATVLDNTVLDNTVLDNTVLDNTLVDISGVSTGG